MSHQPVLMSEVLQYLDPKEKESYLDLTAGYGGHASAVLEKTKQGNVCLMDRDAKAVQELKKRFPLVNQIIHSDFLAAANQLVRDGKGFDLILADLGVSSPHLDIASRGFSIR